MCPTLHIFIQQSQTTEWETKMDWHRLTDKLWLMILTDVTPDTGSQG